MATECLSIDERRALFESLGSEHPVALGGGALTHPLGAPALPQIPSAETLAPPELPREMAHPPSALTRRDLSMIKVIQDAQKAFVVTNPELPDNPIVWTSEAFLHMTGYDRDDVIGRNCRFLQGPRTDPRQVSIIREAVYKEHEASVTILNYRKDGTTFWNRFFVAPLRDAEGKVTFFVGVQTDVSAAFARPGTSDVDTPKPSPATLPRSLGSGA